MLALKMLNWLKGDLSFGLTLAHEPKSLGIAGLEGLHRAGGPICPVQVGDGRSGEGGQLLASPPPSAGVWPSQGSGGQENLSAVSKHLGGTSSGLYFLQEFSQGRLHLLTSLFLEWLLACLF